MANGHGGAREGTGRKAKRTKYPQQVAAMETVLAGMQKKAAQNLKELANGGNKRLVREVWKRKADITKTEYIEKQGPRGGITMLKKEVPKYPDAKDDEMVCVERIYETALPDRAANEYIIDRISGRPEILDDALTQSENEIELNDAARKAALEQSQQWRQLSQEKLASIRNPLTGQTIAESETDNENESTSPDSSTMEDFSQ